MYVWNCGEFLSRNTAFLSFFLMFSLSLSESLASASALASNFSPNLTVASIACSAALTASFGLLSWPYPLRRKVCAYCTKSEVGYFAMNASASSTFFAGDCSACKAVKASASSLVWGTGPIPCDCACGCCCCCCCCCPFLRPWAKTDKLSVRARRIAHNAVPFLVIIRQLSLFLSEGSGFYHLREHLIANECSGCYHIWLYALVISEEDRP